MGKAAKVLLLCQWLHTSAEDEALLFRLRGDMAEFYAELRHRNWRLSLEAASKGERSELAPADASSVAKCGQCELCKPHRGVSRLDGWMSSAIVLCCQAAPDNLVAHCVWAASCGAWLLQSVSRLTSMHTQVAVRP
eukprot:s28_g32.t1